MGRGASSPKDYWIVGKTSRDYTRFTILHFPVRNRVPSFNHRAQHKYICLSCIVELYAFRSPSPLNTFQCQRAVCCEQPSSVPWHSSSCNSRHRCDNYRAVGGNQLQVYGHRRKFPRILAYRVGYHSDLPCSEETIPGKLPCLGHRCGCRSIIRPWHGVHCYGPSCCSIMVARIPGHADEDPLQRGLQQRSPNQQAVGWKEDSECGVTFKTDDTAANNQILLSTSVSEDIRSCSQQWLQILTSGPLICSIENQQALQ